jgi:hypothetical protein
MFEGEPLNPVKIMPGTFMVIEAFKLATFWNSFTVSGTLIEVALLQMLSEPIVSITGGAAEVTINTAILEVTGLEHTPLTLTLKR